MPSPDNDPAPLPDLPEPPTAIDRLLTIYPKPGPFTTVYLSTVDTDPAGTSLHERWADLRARLAADGAPDAALEAIDARLALPFPEDSGGLVVIAASDGSTVVDHGQEPPRHDLAVVDRLPYAAPLLEWDQRRLAHLLVTVDRGGADVAMFGLDHYTRLEHLDREAVDRSALPGRIGEAAAAIRAELVVLSGDPSHTGWLADALASVLPIHCRVVVEPAHDDIDELVDAAVRHLSDEVARETVRDLRELRFLDAHDGAVEGRDDTLRALRDGTADRLLIHDDPNDQERVWIGTKPTDLSMEQRTGFEQARLVDALIRSAVLQGVPVRIIPSTGRTGPEDDTAAMVDRFGQAPAGW